MVAKTTGHKADGEVYDGWIRLTTPVHRSNLTSQTGGPGSMCPLMSYSRKYIPSLPEILPKNGRSVKALVLITSLQEI